MPTPLTQALERCQPLIDHLDVGEQAYAVWYLTEQMQMQTVPLSSLAERLDHARTRDDRELPVASDPPAGLLEAGRDILKETLAQIERIGRELPPAVLAHLTSQVESFAAHMESDLEWDRLFTTPESQAFLHELAQEALEAEVRGETEEGGFGAE